MTWNEVAHGECCTCMLNVSYGNISSPCDSSFRFVNIKRQRAVLTRKKLNSVKKSDGSYYYYLLSTCYV